MQNVISPGFKVAIPAAGVMSSHWAGKIEETVNEVLLLDIRGAQRVFEGGEQVAVNADAAGQEYALWNGKHSPPAAKLPLAIATDRAVSAKDIVSAIADFHD